MPWVGNWRGGRKWKDKDGVVTYVIRRSVSGVRYEVSTRCTSREAAEAQLVKFEKNPGSYAPGPTADQVVRLSQQVIDGFVAWSEKEGHVAETVRRKRRQLGWWKKKLGSRDLRALTQQDLESAMEELKGGRALYVATFSGLWNWLAASRGLSPEANPARHIHTPRPPPAQLRAPKVVTREVFEKTLAVAGKRWQPLLRVLWATGIHLSELSRLITAGRVEELPPGRPDKMTHVLVIHRHKHGGLHKVAVDAEVAEYARQAQALGPFDRSNLHGAVQEACRVAGIKPHWNASWLRHTLATRAVTAGAPVDAVSSFLGHMNRATTLKFYATHGVVPRPTGA